LAGWNSEELGWQALLGRDEPTPENYKKVLEKLYGARADEVLKHYPGTTREEVIQSATDLAGDRFIAYSTWKWSELHRKSGARVYRYLYARPRPAGRAGGPPPARGAVHSAEIEYFIKKADPNGPGLPEWPVAQVMRLDVQSRAEPDATRPRYLFLDQLLSHR
jgi:para-nitrobenzyl esterase